MDLAGDRAIFCPRCQSSQISMAHAGITGIYLCQKCGYQGTLIIQKTFKKS